MDNAVRSILEKPGTGSLTEGVLGVDASHYAGFPNAGGPLFGSCNRVVWEPSFWETLRWVGLELEGDPMVSDSRVDDRESAGFGPLNLVSSSWSALYGGIPHRSKKGHLPISRPEERADLLRLQ